MANAPLLTLHEIGILTTAFFNVDNDKANLSLKAKSALMDPEWAETVRLAEIDKMIELKYLLPSGAGVSLTKEGEAVLKRSMQTAMRLAQNLQFAGLL